MKLRLNERVNMRLLSGIAGGLGALGMCLSSAWALPPVLDRVPAGAMVVMVVPSPDTLQKDLDALSTALEVPGVAIPKIEDLLMMGGITGGIDTSRSFAVVFMAPKPEAAHAGKEADADKDGKDAKGGKAANGEDKDDDAGNAKPDDQFILLLPTGDYAAFVGNFNVKPSGGVDTVTLQDADAQTMFVKNIGDGYAAMGANKELVEVFAGKAGNAPALAASMGAAGTQLADASDFFVVVNMAAARPSAMKALEKAAGGLEDSPMGPAMGAMGSSALRHWMRDRIMNDTRTAVVGLKAGAMGLSLDLSVTFNDGSYLSNTFAGKGDTASLLGRLPNQPFLAAYALDSASPGMKQLQKDLAAKATEGKAEDEKTPPIFPPKTDAVDGSAMAIGAPPGGLMGGLLVNTVWYVKTAKPEAYVDSVKATFAQMDKKSIGGMTFQSSYTPASTEIDGTKVDAWAIKMQSDPEADGGGGGMGAAQGMALLFGPAGGPSGYISAVDGGVVQTFGKNSLLMGAAMKAAKGGESMASDKLLGQVSERLPANRLFEGYLGMKPIADAVLPFLAMAGVQADIQVPETMPPVGLGLGSKDGAARIGVFVPTPVLKLIAEIGMKVGGGHMGAPGGKPKDDTGQPKF